MTSSKCRLFLVTPPEADSGLLLQAALAAAAAGDVASLLIAAGPSQAAQAKALTGAMQGVNVAVLIENDLRLAQSCKADGVMAAAAGFAAAKAAAAGLMVGARCNSRDEAMAAAEAGADFVAFSGLGLIAWWSEIFEVPCVSLIASASVPQGADFARPPDSMWESAETAAAVVRALGKSAS